RELCQMARLARPLGGQIQVQSSLWSAGAPCGDGLPAGHRSLARAEARRETTQGRTIFVPHRRSERDPRDPRMAHEWASKGTITWSVRAIRDAQARSGTQLE